MCKVFLIFLWASGTILLVPSLVNGLTVTCSLRICKWLGKSYVLGDCLLTQICYWSPVTHHPTCDKVQEAELCITQNSLFKTSSRIHKETFFCFSFFIFVTVSCLLNIYSCVYHRKSHEHKSTCVSWWEGMCARQGHTGDIYWHCHLLCLLSLRGQTVTQQDGKGQEVHTPSYTLGLW